MRKGNADGIRAGAGFHFCVHALADVFERVLEGGDPQPGVAGLDMIEIGAETFPGAGFPADAFHAVEYQEQPDVILDRGGDPPFHLRHGRAGQRPPLPLDIAPVRRRRLAVVAPQDRADERVADAVAHEGKFAIDQGQDPRVLDAVRTLDGQRLLRAQVGQEVFPAFFDLVEDVRLVQQRQVGMGDRVVGDLVPLAGQGAQLVPGQPEALASRRRRGFHLVFPAACLEPAQHPVHQRVSVRLPALLDHIGHALV